MTRVDSESELGLGHDKDAPDYHSDSECRSPSIGIQSEIYEDNSSETSISASPTLQPDNAKFFATAEATTEIQKLMREEKPIMSSYHQTVYSHTELPDEDKKEKNASIFRFKSFSRKASGRGMRSSKSACREEIKTENQKSKEEDSDNEVESDKPHPFLSGLNVGAFVKYGVSGLGVITILVLALLIGSSGDKQLDSKSGSTDSEINKPTVKHGSKSDKHDHEINLTIQAAHCWSPSTDAANIISDKPDKAWQCTPPYNSPAGPILTIKLTNGPCLVSAIKMLPGWDYLGPDNTNKWDMYRHIVKISIRFDGTNFMEHTFDGSRDQQQIEITPAIKAQTITMRILKTDPPHTTPDNTTPNRPEHPTGGFGSINLPDPKQNIKNIPSPQTDNQSDKKTFAATSLEVIGHCATY